MEESRSCSPLTGRGRGHVEVSEGLMRLHVEGQQNEMLKAELLIHILS
jgi:hypothetical protein